MDYEITPSELRQRQQRDQERDQECDQEHQREHVLLDVREPWERQTASIEPSAHIPVSEIPARLNELDPDRHIVVYCHHGMRSLSVTAWLRQQGYEQVQSMAGGIDRWSVEIDPRIPRY